MAKIPEYIIEEIRNKISISEIVSQHVNLVKKGGRSWGLCPFHNEKTPSFTVDEEKGFYHCFGCGKGGSVFNFLMEIDKLTFVEAARSLAEKAGVALKEETEDDKKQRNERDALIELYRKLSESFHYILLHKPEAEHALKYLFERKITMDMIKAYKIGYAPNSPDWLYGFLRSKNYSDNLLGKSGIFSRNSNTRYPLFVDRIMFPISDNRGTVIAFGGRSLKKDNKVKYINTPETMIFRKRENLFGFSEAVPAIKELDEIIICEGYFDVIALSQSGIKNAVAPLGTAFTIDQAQKIRRYTNNCILFFDSDTAGEEAAAKTVTMLEKAGISCDVVINDAGKDPADIMVDFSEKSLFELAKKRINGFYYLVKKALNKYDIALPDGKLAVFNEVSPYIEIINSEIKKQSVIKILSDVLEIDENTIVLELEKVKTATSRSSQTRGTKRRPGSDNGYGKSDAASGSSNGIVQQEEISFSRLSVELFLMLTVVHNRKYFVEVRKSIPLSRFSDTYAVDIYTALEDSLRDGEKTFELLLERFEYDYTRMLVEASLGLEEFNENGAEYIVQDAITTIKLRTLRSEQKKIDHKIKTSVISGINEIELNKLLHEKKFIDEEINKLRKS